MKADANQAINAIKRDVGLGRGMLASLKNTSAALIFLGIVPLIPMLEGAFSIDPRIDNLMTIGFREGQVFYRSLVRFHGRYHPWREWDLVVYVD